MESTVTTKRNVTSYTFNWKICHFDIICPEECSQFDELTSERFTVGGVSEIRSKWFVTVAGELGYISCYLNLDSSTNADGTNNSESILCHFTLTLGNDDKSLRTERKFTAGSDWGYPKFVTIKKLYELRESLLQNNTFQLRVQMQIFGEFYNTSSTLLPLELIKNVDTLQILSADFGELFNNKNYSDVEIACGTETFYAHKAIMCARSKVFSAMFESQMKEVATDKVVVTDIDTSTFRAILLYIYTGKVEMSDSTSHTELIYGAEKYDLSGLKQHCFDELCKNVTDDTIGNLAVAAEMYNADEQTKKCVKEYCQRNIADLLKRPAFKDVMLSHPKALF